MHRSKNVCSELLTSFLIYLNIIFLKNFSGPGRHSSVDASAPSLLFESRAHYLHFKFKTRDEILITCLCNLKKCVKNNEHQRKRDREWLFLKRGRDGTFEQRDQIWRNITTLTKSLKYLAKLGGFSFFLNGPDPASFCLFLSFSHGKYSANTINDNEGPLSTESQIDRMGFRSTFTESI